MNHRDLPPPTVVELDPFSEEYRQKLRKELHLDTDEYSHVPPTVLNQFDTLLQKYPHAFLLPGAPLRRIHGTEHHNGVRVLDGIFNAKNQTRFSLCAGLPAHRMSSSEIQAVRNQIDAMLKQDIIRPSKSPSGAPAIRVLRKDLQGKPQPPHFVVDYRALNSGHFPFNKNSGLKFQKLYVVNGTVHFSCTDPIQATARFIIVASQHTHNYALKDKSKYCLYPKEHSTVEKGRWKTKCGGILFRVESL